MRNNQFLITTFLLSILTICGCSRSFILLSPDDLYALGNNYMEQDDFRNAAKQFELIRSEYPTSQFATMSQFKLAQAEYERGRFDDAAIEFELFAEFHPAHKMAPQAQYYLAMSKFQSIPSPERDITIGIEAKNNLEKFLRQYPDHPDVSRVQNLLIEVNNHLQTHEIEVAKVYYRRKSYEAAIDRLEPVSESKASDHVKQIALMLIAKSYEKLNAIDDAVTVYRKVVENGSDVELTEDAKTKLGQLQD